MACNGKTLIASVLSLLREFQNWCLCQIGFNMLPSGENLSNIAHVPELRLNHQYHGTISFHFGICASIFLIPIFSYIDNQIWIFF